jgi:hypothetical protein
VRSFADLDSREEFAVAGVEYVNLTVIAPGEPELRSVG